MNPITDEVKAIDVIAECANGEGFAKEDVKRLAGYFKSKSLTFRSAFEVGGGPEAGFWVGFFVHPDTRDGQPHEKPDYVEFSRSANSFGKDVNNRRQIQRVFTVPTRRVDAAAPQLVRWTLNLLGPAPRPKVVITATLSGCTFAIGVAGNEYFFSHAQALSGERGIDLAQAIHGAGAQMFEPGPQAPTSTFLIHPGDTINERSGFAYGDPLTRIKANVMGLVVKRTDNVGVSYSMRFIVVITNDQKDIKKVVVVKYKDSVWKVKEVTKLSARFR